MAITLQAKAITAFSLDEVLFVLTGLYNVKSDMQIASNMAFHLANAYGQWELAKTTDNHSRVCYWLRAASTQGVIF